MDDKTGIRIALVASIATVLISAPTAAAWLARGYESLAAVAVLCLGVAIVTAGFSLVLRSARRPSYRPVVPRSPRSSPFSLDSPIPSLIPLLRR